jgi:hypothetical protein
VKISVNQSAGVCAGIRAPVAYVFEHGNQQQGSSKMTNANEGEAAPIKAAPFKFNNRFVACLKLPEGKREAY